MADLTTKQLAEAIAQAVMDAAEIDQHIATEPCIQAVFNVLFEHRCWFTRVRETDQGTTFEQMEMFK